MGTDVTASGFPLRIADVGCSVGVSTYYIAEAFPSAAVLDGIDLSPHFLAVAKLREPEWTLSEGLSSFPAVRWIHTNMERSGLPTGQYDLTCVCFVFHELPQEATRNIIAELYRISNSGGVVAITDNNPMSAVIQNLPPALFTLMKATEPWSDQYYVFDLEAALRDAGFVDVKTVETDPRHRTVLARKLATDPDSL
jgi:ubiquinone/menaquinone biosynthesis C-methylase UbiE